jgi:hypothetical protein
LSLAAGKANVIDGADGAAFLVVEPFYQMKGFNHSNLLREDAAQIVADRQMNLQKDGVSDRIQVPGAGREA